MILVGGDFTSLGGQPRNRLGRLHPDGTLDVTFDPGANGQVNSLVLQADGKILVGGGFSTLGGQLHHRIGRLHADGTLDAAFNPAMGSVNSEVYYLSCLALQADGKILVGGTFTMLGGQQRDNLGRLNPDGTLDTAFNPRAGGFASANVATLSVQSDGKILVGGYFFTLGGQQRLNLGRLHPDGMLDTTFTPEVNWEVLALAVQADGKILTGGVFTILGGQTHQLIGRLHPDGTLDAAFNPQGSTGGDEEPWHSVSCLALDADGKILVGGYFSGLGGQPSYGFGRLNPNGTLDSNFNPGEMYYSVHALAVQADGKILAGGYFANNPARLNNTSPATQALARDGSTLTWLRGGSSPEVWRTTFESSTDGTNWTLLGSGTRISGGWKLTVVSLAPTTVVRARGYVAGGGGSSGWYVESILETAEPIRLSLLRDGGTVVLNWTGGQGPYQVQQTTDVSQPEAWQNVGPTTHTNSMVLPLGPTGLFLRVRGQ